VRPSLVVLVALLAVGVALPGVGASRVGSQRTGGFEGQRPQLAAVAYPPPPRILQPGQHAYSSTFRVKAASGRVEFVRIEYLLYTPAGYATQAKRKWPLVLFLHGLGERGNDPWLLTAQPLPKTLAHERTFPALVLSPQLPLQLTFWSDLFPPLDALVKRLEQRYPVDRHRLYVTGLSTGGFGTWEYGLRHPKQIAALVPIAGGYHPGGVPPNICTLRTVPIWAFHGALDTIVPPSQSEILVRALQACGSKVVRFTLYTGVDHYHSWTRAYADPALWRWLFSQRLP
jgi:predicted peptidase